MYPTAVLKPPARGGTRIPSHRRKLMPSSSSPGKILTGVGIGSTPQPAWRPVNDEIDGNPGQHNEIPIAGVLLCIDKALAFHVRCKEKNSQHHTFHPVGQ